MIGRACVSTFKFYDTRKHRMSFKNRPVLVVGQADTTDYIILPISRITNRNNLDPYYDFPIDPSEVPLMNLVQTSYVRTHKQSVVNAGELSREIVDFRHEYATIYAAIIKRMEEFQKSIIANAF